MEAGWIPGTDRILQDRPFPAAPYKQVFICRRCRKGVFSFQNDAGDIEAENL